MGDSIMKRTKLTQGQFALVNNKDYVELSKYKWSAVKLRNSWYAVRYSKGSHKTRVSIYMHRQILGLKKDDGIKSDHQDHNGLNNQRCNLRKCTTQQNGFNRNYQNHSSKYKGVSWDVKAKKWRAGIQYNLKTYHLGSYETGIEAAKIYDAKAKELFGEFARLNNV